MLHRVRPVVHPAPYSVSNHNMNHDCPIRSPWKYLGCNPGVYNFPSWSSVATSLKSFCKASLSLLIFWKSDSIWERISAVFLWTVISLHSNQTHQLYCLARLSVYIGMRMVRLMITAILLGASWTLLLCSLLPPHSWFLSSFGHCIFESFSFRCVRSVVLLRVRWWKLGLYDIILRD